MPEKQKLSLPIAVSRVQVKLTVTYGFYIKTVDVHWTIWPFHEGCLFNMASFHSRAQSGLDTLERSWFRLLRTTTETCGESELSISGIPLPPVSLCESASSASCVFNVNERLRCGSQWSDLVKTADKYWSRGVRRRVPVRL